jgi:hypothetical protein
MWERLQNRRPVSHRRLVRHTIRHRTTYQRPARDRQGLYRFCLTTIIVACTVTLAALLWAVLL